MRVFASHACLLQAQAVLAGGAAPAVLTELTGLTFCVAVMVAVLVRLDAVLFEYVGSAGAARLEKAGEAM